MMKNKFWIFLMSTLLLSEAAMAEAVVKKLPAPVVAGGKPLMETIGERKTIREFKAQNVDDQTLSEILWVAFGISHDGKRTIPTAMNQQNLKVYVVRNDGAWLYDAAENSLTQVTAENLQPLFATQDFMKDVRSIWSMSAAMRNIRRCMPVRLIRMSGFMPRQKACTALSEVILTTTG